jgi:hypothetical protein
LLPLIVVGISLSGWLAPKLPACILYENTGWLCPGCGATRSAIALREGRITDASQNNLFFATGVLVGSTWLVLAALHSRFPQSRMLSFFRFRICFLWLTLTTLLLFWVARNLPWFEFLRPD